ncbi:MAG: family 43 glycosylhydrolase [Kouleothrix sp.]|nr:family 43 glycosylhydrolase [Kouleothrix sp.]
MDGSLVERTRPQAPRPKAQIPRHNAQASRWRLVVGLWSLVFTLAACGGDGAAVQPTASGAAQAPTAASEPTAAATSPAAAPTAGPTPIPTPGPDEYANPVIDQDFPDPDALKVGDAYYAYATGSGGTNLQSARSSDLIDWQPLGDPMPALPKWANPGYTWAPDVSLAPDGKTFVMYFVARDAASDKQCIGAATSEKPEGPFGSPADKPIICQADIGGSIDPASFVDEDGTRYVLWKNDGNCCGFPTYLYIQKTSPDGLALEGEPTQLIKNDQAWEGSLIEAPTLWKQGGKYYLFYSANSYAGADYAVGYATAGQALGPYQKAAGPFLKTSSTRGPVLGPGGQDITLAPDGKTVMLYHTWEPSVSYRSMSIDELTWSGDTPELQAAYRLPEPKP